MRPRFNLPLAWPVGVLTAALLGSWASLTLAAGGLHQGVPSPCVADVDKSVGPTTVLLGETATVTLAIRVPATEGCQPPALHVVLVLDNSSVMQDPLAIDMRAGAHAFIDAMDLNENPGTWVGVVSYGSLPETLCELTSQAARLRSCVNRVGPGSGEGRLDVALGQGLRVLLRGRNNVVDREMLAEVMIVVPASSNAAGCPPVLQAAAQAKGQGVKIYAVCLGPDCDPACIVDVPTSRAQFFNVPTPAQSPAILRGIAAEIRGIRAKRLVVTDQVPANMELDAGSARPDASWDATARTLTWDLWLPLSPVTLTFQVRPLEVGRWPTNVRAAVTLHDFRYRTSETEFPIPQVVVQSPHTQPTPPALPDATPSPAPSATPTPTPTPSARRAYLPWNQRRD
jgi:hypothetical protein